VGCGVQIDDRIFRIDDGSCTPFVDRSTDLRTNDPRSQFSSSALPLQLVSTSELVRTAPRCKDTAAGRLSIACFFPHRSRRFSRLTTNNSSRADG